MDKGHPLTHPIKVCSLFLLVILVCVFPGASYGQTQDDSYTISGKVTDASTGEPLPFCNIYFSQSLKGITSDVNGNFNLTEILKGEYDLVASFIGYRTFQKRVVINDSNIGNFNIKLSPDIRSLEAVEVVGKRDKDWERKLKQFERIILGQTNFSKQCEIKNPWVITFKGDKSNFNAHASQPIEIENNALGFNVKLDLNRFQKLKEVFEFNGYFHFVQQQPKSVFDLEKWKANRVIAYNGSIPHFFKTAINGNWRESGYTVESVSPASGNQKIKPDLRPRGNEWLFYGKGPVQINYHLEYHEGESQSSMIASRDNQPLRLTSHGVPKDPTSFAISGYLTLEGVSTLLPLEYLRFDDEFFKQQVTTDTEVTASFDKAFDAYEKWNPEKLFVRTDKESYYAGETVWMRTYLMNAISHLPVNVPSLIHLQLLNIDGETLFHHRLNSVNGGASANFNLVETLTEGDYLIRAFTDRMSSRDLASNFRRVIHVTGFTGDVQTTPDSKPNLEFFPEGGDLIDGIETTIGFRYNRTFFNGTLFEDEKELLQLVPQSNGMGLFQLNPTVEKRYYVKVEGVAKEFDLPRVLSEGATISTETNSNDLDIRVKVSDDYKKADLYLLIHNKGQTVYFKKLNSSRSEVPVEIYWDDLKPGINHLTLFDFGKRPLAERLVYKAGSNEPSISVDLDKTDYASREKVTFEISSLLESSDTLFTDLSISVLDLDQASQAPGIISYVDVISDLGINIPAQGAFQFEGDFAKFSDLYMLIYSWRRFAWKDFLTNSYDSLDFSPPGIAMEGSVLRENGKPYKNININLLNRATGSVNLASVESNGYFVFENLDIETSDTLVLNLNNPNGRVVNPILKIDSGVNRSEDYSWNHLLDYNPIDNSKDEADELAFQRTLTLNLDDYQLLDEVEISSRRLDIDVDPRIGILGKGNYSVTAKEVVGHETFHHIYDYVRSVPGVNVIRSPAGNNSTVNPHIQRILIRGPKTFNSTQWARILLNNVPVDDEQVMSISPSEIESIEVYTGTRAAAFGARGAQGIVAFFTKRSESTGEATSDQFIKSFTYKNAFYTPNTFQSPDYSTLKVDVDYKDLRNTVYWNPDVSFSNFDKAELEFYTSDRATDLLIDIQGITQNGKLIHEQKIISVK